MHSFDPLKKIATRANAHPIGRLSVRLTSKCARQLAYGVVAIALFAPPAWADVTSYDDVSIDIGGTLIQDNPFTLGNEGIPNLGNSIEPAQLLQQTNYEGRPNITNTANVNFDIIVGHSATGQLILSSTFAVLRDQDLIIGDKGPRAGGTTDFLATVSFASKGAPALFNNDPTIVPYPLTESPSVNPRETDVGFDLVVGRAGTGLLRIAVGGQRKFKTQRLSATRPHPTAR